jgi:pyruvate dehydrogenase complex dehydrogenase (E1) component
LDQDRDPAETREWLDALDSVEAFEGSMIQINAAARLPLKVVHGVKNGHSSSKPPGSLRSF